MRGRLAQPYRRIRYEAIRARERRRLRRLPRPQPRARAGEPVVVVSPHFDDAVFSCWTVLTGPGDVEVLTVFSAGPGDGRTSWWDDDKGVDSATRMRHRDEEDAAALSLAGCGRRLLGLREGQYGGTGVDLERLRSALAGAARVYVPAGVSGPSRNEEHAAVRDACLAVRDEVVLYGDNPYAAFRADVELPDDVAGSWRRTPAELTPEQRLAKSAAIRCYAGELRRLRRHFGDFTRPDALPYEVFWEREERAD